MNLEQMDWLGDFVTQASEVMGVDCSALTGLVSTVRSDGRAEARQEYRDHLRFVYRWISRLNGDKPHDTPAKNWRDYVAAIVHYPLSPWQTGDWFED